MVCAAVPLNSIVVTFVVASALAPEIESVPAILVVPLENVFVPLVLSAR